ncbi:MAG: type II toxin-antitoxin system RelE/ParE family toxin [Proteobacteria bacterium]|nr:MAG: type II toxin-antitoxin system RelE/ParE family toxin [Pseudomonadota bacterium]
MSPSVAPREIYYYEEEGTRPCEEWIELLSDVRGKAKILGRINRAAKGNFGDSKNLSDGVSELRIDFGPGYRVYYGIENDQIILLLGGGSKRTQDSDIEIAKKRWRKHCSKRK